MLGAEVLWGLMIPAAKALLLAGLISPVMLLDLRFAGAAVVFWLFSPLMPRERVSRRDLSALFVASMLIVLGNQGLFIWGVSLTSPVSASICATSMPLLTMLLAAWHLREPITRLKFSGILLGAAGGILLILNAKQPHQSVWNGVKGDTLVLLAEVAFALYLVYFKGLISRYRPYTLMKWMFSFAAVTSLPFSTRSLQAIWQALPTLQTADWGNLAIIVLGGTFLSFLLLPVGQKNLRPTVTAIYAYVQPLVACVIAIISGLDTFSWKVALAAGLVFSGVACVTLSKSRTELDREQKRTKQTVPAETEPTLSAAKS